jgi:hypothetical protein
MGVIQTDEIRGYTHDGKTWCPDCWEREGNSGIELTEEEYILTSNLLEKKGSILFCDECHHEL